LYVTTAVPSSCIVTKQPPTCDSSEMVRLRIWRAWMPMLAAPSKQSPAEATRFEASQTPEAIAENWWLMSLVLASG